MKQWVSMKHKEEGLSPILSNCKVSAWCRSVITPYALLRNSSIARSMPFHWTVMQEFCPPFSQQANGQLKILIIFYILCIFKIWQHSKINDDIVWFACALRLRFAVPWRRTWRRLVSVWPATTWHVSLAPFRVAVPNFVFACLTAWLPSLGCDTLLTQNTSPLTMMWVSHYLNPHHAHSIIMLATKGFFGWVGRVFYAYRFTCLTYFENNNSFIQFIPQWESQLLLKRLHL